MIVAEIRCNNPNDWRGQLRDTVTGQAVDKEWMAEQRGALIGMMQKWIPLSHLVFVDRGDKRTY
jgi:hypothetical protein